jgi:hypothetical protein
MPLFSLRMLVCSLEAKYCAFSMNCEKWIERISGAEFSVPNLMFYWFHRFQLIFNLSTNIIIERSIVVNGDHKKKQMFVESWLIGRRIVFTGWLVCLVSDNFSFIFCVNDFLLACLLQFVSSITCIDSLDDTLYFTSTPTTTSNPQITLDTTPPFYLVCEVSSCFNAGASGLFLRDGMIISTFMFFTLWVSFLFNNSISVKRNKYTQRRVFSSCSLCVFAAYFHADQRYVWWVVLIWMKCHVFSDEWVWDLDIFSCLYFALLLCVCCREWFINMFSY